MTPDVILMKSVAADRRYLLENLAILDPNRVLTNIRYRKLWLAPPFRQKAGSLKGKRALVIFFDWESGLFEAVREVSVVDVSETVDAVQLTLSCGRFVEARGALDREVVPRLPRDGFREGSPEPPDRKGRHAFVYPVPKGWSTQIEALQPREDAPAWFELLRRLVRTADSPYAACRMVFLSHGEERKELRLAKTGDVGSIAGPLRLRVFAFDGRKPDAGVMPVRVIGYVGSRVFFSTEVAVESSSPARTLVPRPDPAVFGERPIVLLEAFPLAYGAVEGDVGPTDHRSTLQVQIGPTRSGVLPLDAGRLSGSWMQALEHVVPATEEQREVCRQILRGVRAHGTVEPGLVDRLIDWKMSREAAAMLGENPGLLQAAGNRQLSRWLDQLTDVHGDTERGMAAEALQRLSYSDLEDDLLKSLLTFLERQVDSEAFWSCLPIRSMWIDSGNSIERIPLVQALIYADELRERLGELLTRHAPGSSRHDARLLVSLTLALLGRERGQELGRQFLKEGRPGLDWPDLVQGGAAAGIRELLGEIGFSCEAHRALAAWYWSNREGEARRLPHLRADLALWLLESASAHAPEEVSQWLDEVARVGLSEGDWVLLRAAAYRLEELESTVRNEIECACQGVATSLATEIDEGLRQRLKGRRLLIVGGQYEPGFLRSLESSLQLRVDFRTKEKSSAFDGKDVSQEVDFCVVLRWAGHDAFNRARDRLGNDRVVFVANPGFRSVESELLRFASRCPVS